MLPESCVAGIRFPGQGGLAKLDAVVSTHNPSSPASRIKRFRIDRARKMNVQVGALGKIVEKRAQRLRPLVQLAS